MSIFRKLRPAALITAAVMTLSSCSFRDHIVAKSRREIMLPTEISFSWWGSEARINYTLEGIDIFEDDNGYKISVKPQPYDFEGYKDNLDALIKCGKQCDLMQLNSAWLTEISPDGEGFYDLNELSDYIDLDNYSEYQLGYCTINGKLNGLPTSLNALSFYHNTKLYAEYGLQAPETWDDLFKAADKLAPDGIYVIESSLKHYWIMLIAHEEQLSSISAFGDGFTVENVTSMMQFYKELIERRVIPRETYDRELFFNGGCASEALWVSDADYYAEPLEEYGGLLTVGEPLKTPNSTRTGWYVKPNQVYAIKKDTSHPEETAKLLNFLVNDSRMAQLQGTEKGIPLSSSALEVLEGNQLLNGAAFEAGELINKNITSYSLMPAELEETERYEAFFEQFTYYDEGTKTAEQAAADFIAEWPFK